MRLMQIADAPAGSFTVAQDDECKKKDTWLIAHLLTLCINAICVANYPFRAG